MTREFSSEGMLGDFSPLDGGVEFYGRVNAFLQPHFVVVDLGAGRGAWLSEHTSAYQRSLRLMKGKVARVIGLDVDPAVLSNPSTDENHVVEDGVLPLDASSVDVVVADFVLEHLDDPATFEREVFRVLRPGGLFCARTPHALNYVALGARLVRNRRFSRLLALAQPAREEADTFRTRYRCNTRRAIRRAWPPSRWTSYTYLYTAEPSYDFGSRLMYRMMHALHRVLPQPFVGTLFVFHLKR